MDTIRINDQKFEDKLRNLFREILEEYIDPDYGMIVKKSAANKTNQDEQLRMKKTFVRCC